MKKVVTLIALLVIGVSLSSCWMEAKGKHHKVEVGGHRVSNDDGKNKK
jgi:hypothetical protein